jgi:hypothetical protein
MAGVTTFPPLSTGMRSPWPFSGILGDGRHSSFNITTNTTATEVLFQAGDFTIDNCTYTVKQQNPGGIFIACTGRFKMTSGGILDANGQGALGASSVTNAVGKNGMYGRGPAGGGGGGCNDGANVGGYGAGTLALPVGMPFANNATAVALYDGVGTTALFDQNTAASTLAHLSIAARILVPSVGPANPGTAGNTPSTTLVTPFFDLAAATDILQLLGFGGGGGSGASISGAVSSGAGGKGGGCILIVCNELDFQSGATIRASGNAGGNAAANASGGGGGGGGVIMILYRTLITNAGTLTISGGAGGTGDGNGGAGGAGYSKAATLRF